MFQYNGIELCGDFCKLSIQIQCTHTNTIPAHLVAVIWLNCSICCRIEQHAGNLVGPVPEFRIFVLDICENLIQIAGMERVDIILSLRGMRVVLGVNNENLAASGEHNIALHDRQHRPNSIIQGPWNL